MTPPDDIFPGSSGVLLPGVRIRLRDDSGGEVEAHEEMGEIEIESPSILRGYVDSAGESLTPPAEKTDFWWSTGDVGLFRKSPSGQSHLFVVDRIRDMIKVKVSQNVWKTQDMPQGPHLLTPYCVGESGRPRPD